MAWDWNTGYKFILFEGNFYPETVDPAPLVYHVGSDANYRKLTFTIGQSGQEALDLQPGAVRNLNFEVDIAGLFETPHTVDFNAFPVVMLDPYSQKIADNYATDMFTLKSMVTE